MNTTFPPGKSRRLRKIFGSQSGDSYFRDQRIFREEMESYDCVPTEDAVQALVDFLVSPLLPSKSFFSVDPPSKDLQERVANRVRAVVLLYNYYHRKQFPLLEFLDFKSFCKMTAIAKPSLIPYMKAMLAPKEFQRSSLQLSILETVIDEACCISTSLEMSTDAITLRTLPVSEVAIFLVDQAHRFCFLQPSSMPCGLWSIIEKSINMSGSFMEKIGSPRDYLVQFAIQAVREKTGFIILPMLIYSGLVDEELTVLEHGVACSFTKHKTAVQFYLMEFHGTSIEEFTKFSVKDVINSLQGPLFRKDLSPLPVVDYFHLLPYQSILSDWLSRQATPNSFPSLLDCNREVDENYHQEPKSADSSHERYDGCKTSIVVKKRRSRRLEEAQQRMDGLYQEIRSDDSDHGPYDRCKTRIVVAKRRSRRLEEAQQRKHHQ